MSLESHRNIPQLLPPDVLIFFHIPKTGGQTLRRVLQRCFPDQYFDCQMEPPDTALNVVSTSRIAQKFHQLPPERQLAVRCMAGEHVSMDVDTIFFKRASKFITLLRHPVDRVVSNFFYFRPQSYMPCHQFIKDMTLEEYLDSGIGLDQDNHQVRLLSGCPELDAPWDPSGRPISTPPVERRHLELAKRNIDERFLIAAPIEQITAVVWLLKRLYGWPLHRVLFETRNVNPNRPKLESISLATRERLEALNHYDCELYAWVVRRFAIQIEPLEPNFTREVRLFDIPNRSAQRILQLPPVRAMVKHLLVRS
jgi:hypothetical protein